MRDSLQYSTEAIVYYRPKSIAVISSPTKNASQMRSLFCVHAEYLPAVEGLGSDLHG